MTRYQYMAVLLTLYLFAGAPASPADHAAVATVGGGKSARPKIGLVLGGGGALGIAHVGVLQALEEQRIPIDCIAGTSMGAIIAGLYAAGLSPDEIADRLVNLDWWDVMKDQTSYRDLDFRRKEESVRYLMDLELGIRGFHVVFPSGLAAGQKLNNLMQSWTVNAVGVSSFNDLNIPYRAVATDLRTGEAVILDHGNLATAMRASMAVPGVFTPVEIDGQLLIDGGLVNNIPVDIVKAMGADIIIAVDVGSSEAKAGQKSDFRSVGEILSRTYNIMQRPKDDARRKAADILVEPELGELTASDFHRARELIPCGKTAMASHDGELGKLSVSAEEYAAWQAIQRKQHDPAMTIRSVEIIGNQRVPTSSIMKRVETKPGDKVDFDRLRMDVARVHGMGDFSTVTHRLEPTGKPGEYDLKIDTQEKYWGPTYMHFGLRLESDFNGVSSWGALLNVRRANMNKLGGETRLDLEVGRQQDAFLEFYQPLQQRGYIFVAPAAEIGSESQDVYQDRERVAEYKKKMVGGHFDLGTQYKQYGEFRLGVFVGKMDVQPETGASNIPSASPQLGAFTTRIVLDRRDERVFSRHGGYLELNGYFASSALGSTNDYDKLYGKAQWFGSWGNNTVGLLFSAGHALGSDVPIYDQFVIGGITTIPGLSPYELRGSYYDIAGVSYRYRLFNLSPSLGKGVYAVAGLSAGNVWQNSSDIDPGDVIVGGLLGFAMDTLVGPIALAYGQDDDGDRQLYLTVGTIF